MATKTVRVHIRTDNVGSLCEATFTIDTEDYADGEGGIDMAALEETAKEKAFQMMEWGFEVEE